MPRRSVQTYIILCNLCGGACARTRNPYLTLRCGPCKAGIPLEKRQLDRARAAEQRWRQRYATNGLLSRDVQ